ncbi:hypothetical protein [Thalassococcus sp. S3]|uniref:hypothetical protein n=1 Tax=Thalassococcus sp. S3 TaxID=2017482 RepID=UPI0010240943|nr:hypothetical protein [Thalassococcus sp. S3]QBF34262.1 hypothetical protein CFI11_24050 [Thalassococcus sp. S3]
MAVFAKKNRTKSKRQTEDLTRFEELAKLQQVILEQKAEIMRLSAQQASTATDTELETLRSTLEDSRAKVAALKEAQDVLRDAVIEKERQRFSLEMEVQTLLSERERRQWMRMHPDESRSPEELFKEVTELTVLLQDQEIELNRRDREIGRLKHDMSAPASLDSTQVMRLIEPLILEYRALTSQLMAERDRALLQISAVADIPQNQD